MKDIKITQDGDRLTIAVGSTLGKTEWTIDIGAGELDISVIHTNARVGKVYSNVFAPNNSKESLTIGIS